MQQLLETENPKQQVDRTVAVNVPAGPSKEAYERKCFVEMEALLNEGESANLAATFVRAATLQLARVVQLYGKRAMTDILRQLGAHIDRLEEIDLARREAEEAKAAGRLPQ
jgi:hypothetical protein